MVARHGLGQVAVTVRRVLGRGAAAATVVAALAACATAADQQQTYVEAALRADAREARAAEPWGAGADEPAPLDTAAIARALGAQGELHGGLYFVELRRGDLRATDPATGAAATLALHPLNGGRMALTGDVSLSPEGAAAARSAFAARGISVTAVESGGPAPARAVVRVWGMGDAVTLAGGFAAALDGLALRQTAAR